MKDGFWLSISSMSWDERDSIKGALARTAQLEIRKFHGTSLPMPIPNLGPHSLGHQCGHRPGRTGPLVMLVEHRR